MRDITKSDPLQKSIFYFLLLQSVLQIRITLMQIQIRIRILLVTWMRTRILHVTLLHADPDPDPSFQIKVQSAQIGSHSKHFGLSSTNWCESDPVITSMRIPIHGSYLSIWCGSMHNTGYSSDCVRHTGRGATCEEKHKEEARAGGLHCQGGPGESQIMF